MSAAVLALLLIELIQLEYQFIAIAVAEVTFWQCNVGEKAKGIEFSARWDKSHCIPKGVAGDIARLGGGTTDKGA